MKEAIVKLTSDHIKVKGAEYVRDLVRCKQCKHWNTKYFEDGYGWCRHHINETTANDFCNYGEVRDE